MKPLTAPPVSLCMIVRNESRSLRRCLDSAAPWVAEMVVVDTGSSDDTCAIAQSAGARLLNFQWIDDFAAARNFALEACLHDWVLVLDADERITVHHPAQFQAALRVPGLAGYSIGLRNVLDNGQESRARVFRLFRRSYPGMRYQGEIHEQMVAVAQGTARTGFLAGAEILHDGYQSHIVSQQDKQQRNIALSRKLTQSRPADPYVWYVLGNSLKTLDMKESIAAYQKALSLWKESRRPAQPEDYLCALYLDLCAGLQQMGRADEAAACADAALQIFPTSPDLHFLRGRMRLERQQFLLAIADLSICTHPGAKDHPLILDPMATGSDAYLAHGMALDAIGQHTHARALLQTAVDLAPKGYVKPHLHLANIYLQHGQWLEARALLQSAHAVAPAEAAYSLALSLYKLGQWGEALQILPAQSPDEPSRLLRARVLLQDGQAALALDALQNCALAQSQLPRAWCLFILGKHQDAITAWQRWLGDAASQRNERHALRLVAHWLELPLGDMDSASEDITPPDPLAVVTQIDSWMQMLVRNRCFGAVGRLLSSDLTSQRPFTADLMLAWGRTLALEGFAQEALTLMVQLQSLAPEMADCYYWMGYCLIHQQDTELAHEMWAHCLALAPQHPLALQSIALFTPGGPQGPSAAR